MVGGWKGGRGTYDMKYKRGREKTLALCLLLDSSYKLFFHAFTFFPIGEGGEEDQIVSNWEREGVWAEVLDDNYSGWMGGQEDDEEGANIS